jgi:hypothetical protein
MVTNHLEELAVAGRAFRFELCRKAVSLGPVRVDHWWMDARRLYGQRGRTATMRNIVVGYFWALCEHHGTSAEPAMQESYILARLLPFARSNAGRKVFADAHLSPKAAVKSQAETIEELDRILQASRNQSLTLVEFKEKTADVLGPPILDEAVKNRYVEFTQEWLGEARAALSEGGVDGFDVAVQIWKKAVKIWGRRGGITLEKRVLDVVSYECRAALHRCYSAAWWDLLPHLATKYQLDLHSLDFLHFWHLDHIREAEQNVPAFFHLFHGHTFALHPVGANIICTPTGRDMIGAWLAGPDHREAFGRLLHAIYIVAHAYALRRADTADERRKRPQPVGGAGEAAAYEQERVTNRGRRRLQKRKTDAR